ncbi:hypothetical protein JTE90_027847 [Oedothorax gibbosus]|uniref:DUF19 domain-containing protein n=1 Tax=Oedothorax gibbosus TaxID=931172 RepID=A0AAV6U216_9ARAC|nr:hypothetical protein JTE90_027847 [Oedothorax gibbosus]
MVSFLVVLISSVLGAVYASPTCDPEAVKQCGLKMDESNPYPINALELKQQCSVIEPKFKCIADFMDRCPGLSPMGTREFFDGAIKLLPRVCHGDLFDKYLNNAECLNKVLTIKQQYCHAKYSHFAQEGRMCEYKNAFTKCVATFLDLFCDKDALDMYNEISKVTKFLYVESGHICP